VSAFDLAAWLGPWRARIDAALNEGLGAPAPAEDPGRLVEAMRYSLLAPGKRLRPLLAVAAIEAVGETVTTSRLEAACAVELVHCYSLVHDDLPSMDDDDFRRGRPSNHKVFGEATAVLAGDALLTLAFEWLAASGIRAARAGEAGAPWGYLEAVAALARRAGSAGMVRGQARDLAAAAGGAASLAALEILHREKTAALFQAALEIGAAVAGARPDHGRALSRYGESLGVAFQHADDAADAEHAAFAEAARERVKTLQGEALAALAGFGAEAEPLRALAAAVGQIG
jgi:geranylgeranyl diphosphate synthase type II